MRRGRKTVPALLLVMGLLLGSVVGGAWASPDIETIHACVTERSGSVRIVSSASDCSARETAIEWNVVGPPGPSGEDGEAGPPGPPGPSALLARAVISSTGDIVAGTNLEAESLGPGRLRVTIAETTPQVWHVSLDSFSARVATLTGLDVGEPGQRSYTIEVRDLDGTLSDPTLYYVSVFAATGAP